MAWLRTPPLRGRVAARARDESGVVAALVAIMLTVFLAASALAIDLGNARGTENRAQAAADASALAAADTLATCAVNGTVAALCTQATSAATTIAATNKVPTTLTAPVAGICPTMSNGICVIAPYPYGTGTNAAKVVISMPSGGSFAGSINASTPVASASSIAVGHTTTTATTTTTTGINTNTTTLTTTVPLTTTGTSTTTSTGASTSTYTSTSTGPAITTPIFAGSTSCALPWPLWINGFNGGTIQGIASNGALVMAGVNGGTITSASANSSCLSVDVFTRINSVSYNSGNLPYPIDYRQASQTISCPNQGAVNSNGNTGNYAGTVTESNTDTYNYSQNYLKFGNGTTNVSGVYCANVIDLTNNATLSGNATFIANDFCTSLFGTCGVSDTGTVTPSSAFNKLLLWQTSSGTTQINSPTFLNGGVLFGPYSQMYINSNALTGGNQSFLSESNTFYLSNFNSGNITAPSGLASTTTVTGTTTIPYTTTGYVTTTGIGSTTGTTTVTGVTTTTGTTASTATTTTTANLTG